ncbi:MAG: glycosyltransferase family 2 protein [Prevotella sp.]|nr:glycosyltransferase family 2 protein [Prevotella sp.]
MNHTYHSGLVSLVTPGWNGKAFVHRLLDSIITQTYRPIQYIYVDDGSTDGTSDIVKGYEGIFKEAGIDFLYIHQENSGMCQALMNGFQYVKGAYLSNPEYDDILFPESVERRVQYLKSHPDCAVVVADAWVVPENHLDERKRLISHKNPNRFDRNHFYQSLMSNTIFNAACYMVRMERFDETHPNRQIIPYPYGSNQQILLPLYYRWNRGFIDEPLSLFVTRPSSLSKLKKSLKEEADYDLNYKELLFSVIDGIDMPEEDKSLYKERVEINVQKDLMLFGEKYGDKKLYQTAYQYLKDRGEAPPIQHKEDLFQSILKKLGLWSK